ncbi:hypothetical protein MOO44_04945 [Nicoliella spurrieriana]|uniref:Uncharacterized protein n=1 Tax=Nicoliella spurrieriana TaxID=2925830 RepID=A0A976RR48_9LACO|nr:hypothetical protein [Nicoliella spurrieriana]UQS86273.1 hypothetical protein MOO44_04945 [Nicoliella spurrieriana]
MKTKIEREERQKAIVDMNSFLLTYAVNILPSGNGNIAGTVYDAMKNDLTGLDALFNDGGIGRTLKFTDIAAGCARNLYDLDPEAAEAEGQRITTEAVNYLGNNINSFNHWLSE